MKNLDLEFTKQLLTTASASVCEALKNPYETKWKSNNTPVTDIDLMVTNIVTIALKEKYPEDTIYGEEEAKIEGSSGFTWILDPIDGTQALGMLTTSTICLARINPEGSPVFSVVVNPTTKEMFHSELGDSFINGQKMTVSNKDTLKGSYIYLGSKMSSSFASNGSIYDSIEKLGG